NVVNWINENKNNIDCDGTRCPIQFLVVLGDIADSAEKSEFLKAKEILDKLNDPNNDGNTSDGIPYVPLFGNHDVWSYTESNNATSALGEKYFDQIFWDENETNTKLMKERLKFQRDELHKNYKNFVFNCGKINFVGLDFNSREPVSFGKGVGSDAVAWREECAVPVPSGTTCPYFIKKQETLDWLEEKLEEFEGEPVILFSHHPMKLSIAEAFSSPELLQLREILKNKSVVFDFGGHIHSFEGILGKFPWVTNANKEYNPINSTRVITTEALMVGSNGRGVEKATKQNGVVDGKKGIIRIVKIFGTDDIRSNNWETTETGDEFVSLNPNFDYYPVTIGGSGMPIGYRFVAKYFTERKISKYKWDFGFPIGEKEGEEVFISVDEIQQGINLGTYEQTGTEVKIPVKLTLVDEKTQEDESIPRKEKVYFSYAYLIIGPSQNQFISLRNYQKLTVTTENRNGVEVLIDISHSASTPVGIITVNFGEAEGNIDLSELIADSDIKEG
ncbi:metallophosphoesterase, partial [bacterium]|nr:metallophosphoesterase [bacterium]